MPFHVLLIAIYPILFLYSENINELPNGIFFKPCIYSSIFSVFLFTCIYYRCKHIKKTGIITSFVLIIFFTFGHIRLLFNEWGWRGWVFAGHEIRVATYLGPLYLIGLLFGLYCFGKMRGNFTNSTNYLNTSSLLLVSMMIFNILRYENIIPEDNSPHIDITLKANDPKPDIYFINLDGYPRADILKKYYEYDNRPFLGKLESLGFNVIEKSQSNYDDTRLSIRSTLEMDYLDKLFSSRKEYNKDNKLKGLRYTNVLRILHNSGYKTNAFKTGWYLTELNNSPYIKTVLQKQSGYNHFVDLLLKTSPFEIILHFIPMRRYRHRDRQLFILDSLPKFSKEEGPCFIYANLLCPHPPFVFDVNGNWVNWPRSSKNMFVLPKPGNDKDKEFMTVKKHFRNQITYVNNRILQDIESILKNSDKESVIIIQSDHGERHLDDYFECERSVKFCNLSAIYLPNGRQHEIPSDASNVNTFRYVFNHVFNTKLPILPNKSYVRWKKNL